jgi:hypothetical protein
VNAVDYTITSPDDQRFRIDFRRAETSVVGLCSAPNELEAPLRSGKWLVLAFAVWDIKDRPSISLACRIASEAKGYQVAVRPFESGAEFANWASGYHSDAGNLLIAATGSTVTITTNKNDHPVWLALRDGVVLGDATGACECGEVLQLVKRLFAQPE